mgnify:CR=1 FL=1
MNTLTLLVNNADLLKSLEIMWKGVVAIFVVIALIIIVTKVVNKVCVDIDMKREEREKEKGNQSNPNQ